MRSNQMTDGRDTVSSCTPAGQARRLAAFRRQYPEWRIGFDHSVEIWRAYRDLSNGFELHCQYVLKDLLDKLEEIAAQGEPAGLTPRPIRLQNHNPDQLAGDMQRIERSLSGSPPCIGGVT